MQHRLPKAISSVVGGFLTHLVMGAFYMWGNISLYVTSYYRLHGYPDLENSSVQAVFPFIYLGIVGGHFVGLVCARKFGHKLFSGINMIVYCFSFYIASVTNFYAFVIFMGFLPGLCIGNEYMLPVDNAYFYYPIKKGIIGGCILCGQGFGALLFNPVFQYMINPEGEAPDSETELYSDEIANRFPHVLQTLVYVYAAVGILGVLLMFQTRKYLKMENNLSRHQLLEEEKYLNHISEVRINNQAEAFKTRQLYMMWFQFYTCCGFGQMMASNYKTYGLTRIDDDNFIAIVGSVGAAFNGISRFVWAAMLDYISADYLIPLNSCLLILLSSTMDFISTYKSLYMIWIVLVYLQYGGLFSFFPTLATRIYGATLGPHIYNMVGTAMVFSNFTQFFIVKYAMDSVGYKGIFYIYSGMGALSILIHFINLRWRAKLRNKIVT